MQACDCVHGTEKDVYTHHKPNLQRITNCPTGVMHPQEFKLRTHSILGALPLRLSEANRRSILENLGLIPGVVLGLGRNSHQEKAATPCFFARRHHTQLYRLPGASWQLATQ